jgi:hypothetical protein
LLEEMGDAAFNHTYVRPEHGRVFTLVTALARYAWRVLPPRPRDEGTLTILESLRPLFPLPAGPHTIPTAPT